MAQLLLFMLFFLPYAGARNIYSMADLEVLVRDHAYPEFFDHALDIRPSERQDAWKTMVSQMAEGFSRKILQKSQIERIDFQKIEELFTWPSLKTDDIFKIKRQEIGLKYLQVCIKVTPPCSDEIKTFWEQDKTDAEKAFKLAEITSGLEGFPISTWSFLEVSLKSPLSEFYCKKDFALNTLWGKLEIDYIKLGPQGDMLKKLDETVHPDCLPTLNAEARKRLFHPIKKQDRELSFQILKSQMKTDQKTLDFFYTVYLLENPSQGELFNYSWNRIRELGGEASRREHVLSMLKALDPLPDSIMGSLDQTKKKVVLKHFKSHFPEYLDFYTDQCLKFYGGKQAFPDGNPTVHCQEFMSSELAPIIIDDFKLRKYNEAKKI
jgi:hypothetical protein